MYAHCLFCNTHLGRNDALEAFPVGRRLAYDAEKGRLWVVCAECGRWNLTPLEERWEAIEQAERLYRGTRLRASTDNVGLARLPDRTELVRVGRPLLPELSAWRYGRTFVHRRRLAIAKTVAVRAAWVGILAGIATLPFGAYVAMSQLTSLLEYDPETAVARHAPNARVPMRVGRVALRLDVNLANVRVRLGSDGAPTVLMPWGREVRAVTGPEALRALGPMLASVNASGAPPAHVDGAVSRLAEAGSAGAYLAQLARGRPAPRRRFLESRRPHDVTRRVSAAPGEVGLLLHTMAPLDRLAFEMAIHDVGERRAMDGELAALEQAWRDAEEIAAIADELALPRGVETAWDRLRGSVRR